MPSELIVAGALANCGRDAPTDEFLQTLVSEIPALAAFRFHPRPGIGVKAALDWQAILGSAADLLAFAGAIWAAYERFVKPRRQQQANSPHQPFLLITLRRPDGTFTQFALGNEYSDKEIFVEHFVRQVSELRAQSESEVEGDLLSGITESEEWVRIHARDSRDS